MDALAKREAFAISLRKEKKTQLIKKKREKLQRILEESATSRYNGDPSLTPELLQKLTQECAPDFDPHQADPLLVSVTPSLTWKQAAKYLVETSFTEVASSTRHQLALITNLR